MSFLDIDLPSELHIFKKNIEASVKQFVEIKAKAKAENNLHLSQSKFGGFPYFPKEVQYPKDVNGQPMILLAQINFTEVPYMDKFPATGILQFYISNNSDVYGMCFDDLSKQDGFTVLYFPEISKDESKLITDFDFLPKPEMLPFENPCSLTFSIKHAPISVHDYQFEAEVLGENIPESRDELYKIYDIYEKTIGASGHKIGGYPYFTQNDPRHSKAYKDKKYFLLFQMDTDDQAGIMWGDCGVANFFILEEDLEKKDFSKVLYNWDCC